MNAWLLRLFAGVVLLTVGGCGLPGKGNQIPAGNRRTESLSNISPIAVDVRWSNYGAYLQKMIETVQIQWERIMIESRVYPQSGTQVQVVFRMNSEGAIYQIVSVDGTAGKNAEKMCTSAIASRSPYGRWTEGMKTVLGESQEMTFTFYYQ